jgi:hypothetical protein
MAYYCLGLGLRHARASLRLPALDKQTEKTRTPLRDGATGCPPARRQECANSGHSQTVRRTRQVDP